ncbi:MAG: M28 family peptidase [bacterium]|nr:M28 family peptidase [bacterium]
MRILSSSKTTGLETDANIQEALSSVTSEHVLREFVRQISFPRHFSANPRENQHVEEWISDRLRSYGYHVFTQGKYDNIVALPSQDFADPLMLVGAHYGSVPWSPGTDDNASAIAALLGCAKAVAEHAPNAPVCFTAFNREEDLMIGGADFVKNYVLESALKVQIAHILEMVGYCSHQPNSQCIATSERLPK